MRMIEGKGTMMEGGEKRRNVMIERPIWLSEEIEKTLIVLSAQ